MTDCNKPKKALIAAISQKSQTPQRPTIQLQFETEKVTALIDSGASLTCLSASLYKKLTATDKITKLRMPQALNFKSASGHKLTVQDLVVLTFIIPGLGKVKWPCLVMPNLSSNFILGNCFLTAHGAQLDFVTKELKFHPTVQLKTATVQKSFWLPPGTSRFITAITDMKVGEKAIVHDTADGATTYGLQTVSATGKIAIHLTNNTATAKVYAKGEKLANLEYIKDEYIYTIEEVMKSDTRTRTKMQKSQGEKSDTRMPKTGKLKPDPGKRPHQSTADQIAGKLSQEKRQFILSNIATDFNGEDKKKLETLVLRYHDVFSANKFDIGHVSTVPHKLHMKTEEPIFTKQFPIPEAHTDFIKVLQIRLQASFLRKNGSSYSAI